MKSRATILSSIPDQGRPEDVAHLLEMRFLELTLNTDASVLSAMLQTTTLMRITLLVMICSRIIPFPSSGCPRNSVTWRARLGGCAGVVPDITRNRTLAPDALQRVLSKIGSDAGINQAYDRFEKIDFWTSCPW